MTARPRVKPKPTSAEKPYCKDGNSKTGFFIIWTSSRHEAKPIGFATPRASRRDFYWSIPVEPERVHEDIY
jgi:hypothetical protein